MTMGLRALFLITGFICANSLSFGYQNLGILKGTIINKENQSLADAIVRVTSTGQATLTDGQGVFALKNVPTGKQTLVFQFPGYDSVEREFAVKPGLNPLGTITLDLVNTSLEIVIRGSLAEGQARALNQQRLANNIKNIVAADQIGTFPDTNAAEATQRIPGVNIARDQGEGRYVQIRGTESRLNQTSINGEPVPAPEGDLRTVALDVVPLEMLEAIEVTKAVTADMDGDAVGGSVNLRLRKAPRERTMAVTAEAGYNELSEEPISGGSFLYGEQFQDGKYGLVTTFSFEETDRGNDNFEAEWDDGLPEELEQRDYAVNRERIGAHVAFDYNPSPDVELEFNGSYSQFDDQEFRHRVKHVIEDGELERELKDRYETQSITTLQTRGEVITGNMGLFQFSANYSYARESEPGRLDSEFKQEDVIFAPNYAHSPLDPDNIQPNPTNQDLAAFEFDKITQEENFTNDEHLTVKASYEWPIVFGDHMAQFKVGGKYRAKEKTRDNNAIEWESDEDLVLSDFLDSGYSRSGFLSGRYDMGRFQGREQVRDILDRFATESEIDYEADAADYQLEEDLYAGYFMATLELGEKWMILPGLRFERFDTEYTGYQVLFDDEGDYQATTAVPGENDEDILLPNLHVKYRVSDRTQVRFAQTRTYARANVYDQVPYRLILEEDSEIEEGNPDLDITLAWNTDIMVEHYFEGGGVLTAGLFYKDLEDYIYIFNTDESFNGEEFEVTRPLNGPAAELTGLELAFQKTFKNGFGFYLNYTYADSEAGFQDREGTILPGQTENLGNLALIYEREGLSVRVSGNLHGEYISEIGDDADEDIWVDEHFQIDLNASYTHDRFKVFLELVNLNDEPVLLYEGNRNQPIQYEEFGFWGRLGLKYDF
ncbi:TonB-dependent receptor [Sulfidibacter corallicola]|uniref:TonB-dependent receptor n=1 Tax=Sulfidibacter corallicola TaxID=2818388 RepID=A0A8A4TN32_SULCO|nr:TonB-dependent receptor [Sulfidibacter corallicola]QTD50328.1 TonB-dependent receptor [Sulfidibacter corallicola]